MVRYKKIAQKKFNNEPQCTNYIDTFWWYRKITFFGNFYKCHLREKATTKAKKKTSQYPHFFLLLFECVDAKGSWETIYFDQRFHRRRKCVKVNSEKSYKAVAPTSLQKNTVQITTFNFLKFYIFHGRTLLNLYDS